ncbi:uncharacterized protein LOC6617491 isoform X2 [Drosophila sechellia]|uniref:uncharacterized protein LOC6617491 isoform X2 n=1 Tax=Drosophila sechellia TaxID=7238 RepID=UPI0013DDB253|nr:uncharacterized protein LOC6617491 isoform X2 [Drosophila sechellia]
MSMHQLLLYSLCLWAVVVFCAPTPSESRRVIFLKPNGIHRGQILATHGMEKSCPKCHMLDHRGNCRRIIAYNAVQRLLILTFVVLAMILAQRPRITEARRLIFYNPHTKPLTSQLLVSRRLTKPCPAGKMRDHRDRCRRAVIFGRST